MRTASEVVQHLNESKVNIYELSEQLGLGKTTIRARLMKLGYEQRANGDWVYSGEASMESKDEDVVSNKRMIVARDASVQESPIVVRPQLTIHQSLMQLDLNEKPVRTTISLRSNQIESMKMLANATRLRLNDVYSLAIAEFLERYATYGNGEEDKL